MRSYTRMYFELRNVPLATGEKPLPVGPLTVEEALKLEVSCCGACPIADEANERAQAKTEQSQTNFQARYAHLHHIATQCELRRSRSDSMFSPKSPRVVLS